MRLPIYVYGQPVLRRICKSITADHPGIHDLIQNMWETMYGANGIGLAAPQIGLPIRLFLVDSTQLDDEETGFEGIKRVFINAQIEDYTEATNSGDEGCLSIPGLTGKVDRPDGIRITYLDEDFQPHVESFEGWTARVVQHEYDHIEGRLFTDLLTPVKRRLVAGRLEKMRKGKYKAAYPTKPVA